ncbi:unnamed protein product [Rhizoctonia solani]|uniref:AAA+ ATPase domain-containing protein n=1 Tax=Rhizoctonia solani TaxID=456999 RepID=A0A8H3DW38_9AGAM|nr:unnamed protein product [Rhizoctonia solani]
MRRADVRAHVPVYRRTPENSVDSFSSSEEDEPVQEHHIDEHSAAAPSLIFSSIYGPRPNSINRLQLANVDLPVSPESLPHTPPRTSRPPSHHSAHNHLNITSPTPSRPLSSSLGIGIGGRAQGGLAEVFTAIANTQAQALSTALPPSSAGSLPSPLSLSPKSPASSIQEVIVKDEGYSLEQLPFKLTLSNQSSLLLNRTSRAAQRRSSSLPQRQDTSSSSGGDPNKRPTNLSAPERLSISSLPRHPGDRPISVSSVEYVEEEEQADDEQDEEEQEIVDESPSFEALQPYPRDVSGEPSPDPFRQGFIPPAPPLPPAQPPKSQARNNSDRYIDHELVIDELEERLGVEPTRRRRARSNAVPNPNSSGTSPNRSTSQPDGKPTTTIRERKPPIELPKSNVDMAAARNMLGAMFAKRNQQVEEKIEEKVEEHSSDEHSFLPVDWDIGSMAGLDEEDRPEKQEDPTPPEPTIVQHASIAARRKSTAVRRESTVVRRESTVVRRESANVRRESVNVRRKSTTQSRTPIPIPQHSPPIPTSQLASPDAHPQTPSTPSTIPETPNTRFTQSTQPTPSSDHGFGETDTDDEHPEDLADLIEAEPVVLSTPRSVVLRREVGRETSLPSRTGTGNGSITPGVWTPRHESGAWTPAHGSVIGGSGGLQVIESPTVERGPFERRQSVGRSQPTLNERRRSTSGLRIEDLSQSTISDVTLDTVSGQTEDVSPVSRPVVSDRALVSAPIAAPAASAAPILGSVSPLGNGLGLGLSSVPSTPLELISGNGLGSGSGVLASDIVSPPSTSTPSGSITSLGNALGLEADSGSDMASSAPSGSFSDFVGSSPVLSVASEQIPQAAPVDPISPPLVALDSVPPVVSTSEPTIVPRSISLSPVASPSSPASPYSAPSIEPVHEPPVASTSSPLVKPTVPRVETLVSSTVPEPAPQVPSHPTPEDPAHQAHRAEPDSPESEIQPLVLQENTGSVPSVESGPLPSPSSESNLAARSSPSLVAGLDSKDDPTTNHPSDLDPSPIPVHSSESSGAPAEPIRDTPHGDRVNLDSEHIGSGLNHDTVELHVPEQGSPSPSPSRGDLEGSPKSVGDLPSNEVQVDTAPRDGMGVVKETDEVVVKGKGKAETASVGPVAEKSEANISGSHADFGEAVHHVVGGHQELAEERPQAISTSAKQDTTGGSKVDIRGVQQDVDQESFGTINADIGSKVEVEPTAQSGDLGARALVSDSESEPTQDVISVPTNSPPSRSTSALPNSEAETRISQDPITEEAAPKAPRADEVTLVEAAIPSVEQASLGEANQEKKREEARTLQDVPLAEEEQGGTHMDSRVQKGGSADEENTLDGLPTVPVETGATVESIEEMDIMGQDILGAGIRDEGVALEPRESPVGTLLQDHNSATEKLASDNRLEERAALETLETESPSIHSALPPVALIPELAPTTRAATPLSSVPIADETALEPDHVDSLSELEESFGVRSPVMDEPLSKPASPQPVAPSLPPAISAPAQALSPISVSSPLPVLERSPMLPPLSPVAPLSPILPSSASVSPSPPEPLSPEPLSPAASSSPPTTSSLPGSPSPALSIVPPTSSTPEPQSILSLTKALSADVATPISALSRSASLESERGLAHASFSQNEPSVQAKSSTMLDTSTSPAHSASPDLPSLSENHLLPETPLMPKSPSLEAQLSPVLSESTSTPREVAPERTELDSSPSPGPAPEPDLIPSPKSSAGVPIAPSELLSSPGGPQSSKSISRGPSASKESTGLPQPPSLPERSLVSESLETPEALESPEVSPLPEDAQMPESSQPLAPSLSPVVSIADLSPPLGYSPRSRSQSLEVGEPVPTLATPPAALPTPHSPRSLPAASPSPDPGSSFAVPEASSPGPSYPNASLLEPTLLDDPCPLSEPTSGSVLPASPESPLPEPASPPKPSEPAVVSEPSELFESISLPNTSPPSNTCLPDVSIPLEPSSSPRPSLPSPPLEQAELPEPSPLLDPSSLHESSLLITPPLFEPPPWPGLSVTPKPSPPPLPVSSPHEPSLLELSPSPDPTPLPDVHLVPGPSSEPQLPPTEGLQWPEKPVESVPSGELLNDSQGQRELQVTPDHRQVRGTLDPLSPWGSLRPRKPPSVQNTLDDGQPLPKSSLLFDSASLPADSPLGSRTPSPRLPTLPQDSPLLQCAPPLEYIQSVESTERFEDDRLPERSGEPWSPSPVEKSQRSQRSSLSEIPSLSDFAPPIPRSNTVLQYVRTATLSSESQTASEPSSKSRPRSQLKPLRLSLLHGLGTPPGAIITPVSANTVIPSPGLLSEAATPTPTAMYPTPSSAHPAQVPINMRSAPQSPPAAEETSETTALPEPEPTHGLGGLDSVSWFGSKQSARHGTLSAARQSIRRSVQGSTRSSLSHDTTVVNSTRSPTPAAGEQSLPQPSVEYEDVRPLPMIWDDESEVGSKASSSRRGTRSPTQSQSRTVPALEPSSTDTALKTPDRLDTVPRYPTFVHAGTSSPRNSEGRPPMPSSPVASEPSLEPHSVQQSEVEPTIPRNRQWADTINRDSIGSLPDFSAPAPSTQMPDGQSLESQEPHTPNKRKDRRHYMKIPNTAPLAISPRRVSPSIMQRSQEEGMGSYEQDVASQDEMQSYSTFDTASLERGLRMPMREGTNGPWMTEYFTNSPSSFHGSQIGSIHSASSSLSIRAKAMATRQSVSSSKQVNGPVYIEDGTFGNPGPGPSTMKTYSERRQSAKALGSPIAMQPPSPERAPSVPKTPQPRIPADSPKRTSRQLSLASIDATPRNAHGALQLKVSSAESITESEMNTQPGIPSPGIQLPAQIHSNEVSPTEQRSPYKALSLSSPSPGRHPPTPLTAPSPLQILRRNLMARTSPESPRFVSPQTKFSKLPESRPFRHQHHASASLAPMAPRRDEFRNAPMSAPGPRDRRSLTPNARFAATPSIPGSPALSAHSTISQTKPLLFFAIAKNSAQEVERLLQDGEVKPNDKAGPEDLPALAFTLANEQLSDKTQIVKSLLSHGADPSSVLHRTTGSGQFDDADLALTTRIEQGMNPAIRYYLNRKQMTIPALQAELLEKHNFGGLTRAGFSIIGQDAALEELIRVVAGHCRRQALNPLVVVFSGGPGCGKSLLASKIGPLLHVPYFTVNMTNLRNEAALFNYISMTTKVGQPQIPLMDFLRNNQGQRCVVVLEEIEKAADKTVWHSLLMPWELGKATVISPTTNEQIDIDTSQVIWIATSNSGDDATLKFFAERSRPSERGESALVRLAHNPRPREDNFTRKDYLQLMQAVRKRLGELLGSSMISRVSSVLPFLPFTEDEVYALASESLSAMRAEQKGDQNYQDVDWEELLQQAVGEYIPGEGARSVHRAVQRAFDEIAEW